MAFELITGHAGRNHVDSADMGEAFAGIVGKGRYILDTGKGMACSMADSNTLTVGTGSMLMDGRIVRNETPATFKIANGTQGQYRHDLACLRYTLDRSNDSIESVEQVVLQGTPATTASEAKDPEYEAGDILAGDLSATVPIARVKLDNLTPTCEAMLGSVTSLKSLGDSVSLAKDVIGWHVFRISGLTIASYTYADMLFSGGNEYIRSASMPLPAGFTEPPKVLMTKCGNDNSTAGVSAIPRVTAVTKSSVDLAFTSTLGSLPSPFKQAFSLLAIGV